MSNKTFTEDFVTIESFCQKLNYSKHTIKPYISKGILPPLRKLGNQQVWDNTTDEFEIYIKKINERKNGRLFIFIYAYLCRYMTYHVIS